MSNVSIQTMQTPLATPARPFAAYVRLQDFAATLTRAFGAWPKDTVDHTRLYRLNDHMRRDIGITRHDFGHGPAESFWKD